LILRNRSSVTKTTIQWQLTMLPEATSRAWTELPDAGLISVSGADTLDFLQGQLSTDVRAMDAHRGQISSFNSPKGRILAILHAFRDGERVLLECPQGILDAVLKRLQMYVLRARAVLTPASDLSVFGLLDDAQATLLRALQLPVPDDAPCARASYDGVTLVRRHGARARYTMYLPRSQAPQWIRRLDSVAPTTDLQHWKLESLRAGEPVVYAQTQDRFVPQHADLDLLGGISLSKGCYTGQEVVARLHYLGQVKRRLFLLRAQGQPPTPGTAVIEAASDAVAGDVMDAEVLPDGSCLVLAVLQLAHAGGDLRLAAPDGAPCSEVTRCHADGRQ
jgi:tRNA-modifying protein YgfZ